MPNSRVEVQIAVTGVGRVLEPFLDVLADLLGQAAVVGEELGAYPGPRGALAEHVGVDLDRGPGVGEDEVVRLAQGPEQVVRDRRPVGRLLLVAGAVPAAPLTAGRPVRDSRGPGAGSRRRARWRRPRPPRRPCRGRRNSAAAAKSPSVAESAIRGTRRSRRQSRPGAAGTGVAHRVRCRRTSAVRRRPRIAARRRSGRTRSPCRTNSASSDSGVISNSPAGARRTRALPAAGASPCQRCTGRSSGSARAR